MLNTERMIKGVATALSVLLFTQVVFASESAATKTWQVAEDVYRFGAVDGRNGYYSMFVVTSEGVIAIEPVNPEHAKGLLTDC